MGRLTIYDIKRLSSETSPFYFSPKTLKFFGQTMKGFSVKKQPDGRYKISARINNTNQFSVRFFNPINNELEFY